jgi:hypothetical protein
VAFSQVHVAQPRPTQPHSHLHAASKLQAMQ